MIPRQRTLWVIVLLSFGFTLVSYRLVYIQLVDHEKYRQLAIENHCDRLVLPARRGLILDTHGETLAQTQTLYEVRVDGANMREPAATVAAMEKILRVNRGDLTQKFNPRDRYQLFSKVATEEMVTQLKELEKERLAAWRKDPATKVQKVKPQRFLSVQDTTYRAYPNGTHASHLVGFLDSAQHGASGIENVMESYLAGIPGERWIEKDVRGREIAAYRGRDQQPVDGFNVGLTIDLAIQHIIEEGLDQVQARYQSSASCAIVMQPHTGEILALANRPTFDPNNRRGVPVSSFRNRALTDMIEPGSTYKIVTMAAALNERLFTLDSPIYCESGKFFYADKWLHDHEPYGLLSLQRIMAVSSNIGFAKVALELGDARLYDYAKRFGFGVPTNVLPGQGESGGLLRPLNKWSKISVTRIPMGQEVAATPLQMISAMSVVANGGRLIAPRVIKQVTDHEGRVIKFFPPRVSRQVISTESARLVSQALASVVSEEGTARLAAVPGFQVAGKTGTAQKFINGAYSKEKYLASFIGYLPEENPAFVLLIMVDEPKGKEYYGGQVAAPAFSSMAKQIAQVLNVEPVSVPALKVERAAL
jgi:cell division protein FtsI/penicillin-binding protein 2